MENSNTEIVVFNEVKMICPVIDGEPFVLVKSIIDGIGLNYDNAVHNLKNNPRLNRLLCEYKVNSDKFGDITLSDLDLSKGYMYTAIPIRKVAAWLYSINTNKVNENARVILENFQDTCDDVLFDHFFGKRELEKNYVDDKKQLVSLRRQLESEIKAIRNVIALTPEAILLNKKTAEWKSVKVKIQKLENKLFGTMFNLFDSLPTETTEVKAIE